ncbi:hypothetical protein [Roseomonas elaeocarpi]|uniref:Uncharacterized protein n=1 Tax=Roseomonas elaeocarpi TaxID=907779 RepID=A0ABV6JQB3_9PROT
MADVYLSAKDIVSAMADDDTFIITWKDAADSNKLKIRRFTKAALVAAIVASVTGGIAVPAASDAVPSAPSDAGAAGTLAAFSRADHSHPRDTSKADVTALAAATAVIANWTALQSNFTGGIHRARIPAGAVNGIELYGGVAGAGVSITPVGTDTNIGLALASKGTGAVDIRPGGARGLFITATASGVNSLLIGQAITGAKPTIGSGGADTNVGGKFTNQGTAGWEFANPVMLRAYTFATLPDVAAFASHTLRISDRSNRLATSDGTNWRFTDGTIVS